MFLVAATATPLVAAAAVGGAVAGPELPPKIIGKTSINLEDIRDHSDLVFESAAGSDGPPITREEFTSMELPDYVAPDSSQEKLLGRLFERLDRNGDGQVTRQEWDTQTESELEFADANDDGKITLTELANARKNLDLGGVLNLLL